MKNLSDNHSKAISEYIWCENLARLDMYTVQSEWPTWMKESTAVMLLIA